VVGAKKWTKTSPNHVVKAMFFPEHCPEKNTKTQKTQYDKYTTRQKEMH